MKALELNELSVEELREKLEHVRGDLFNLKFQHSTGQLENPMRIPQARKDIARILTVLKEKELAA